MRAPRTRHLTASKMILKYIQGTLDFGIMDKRTWDFQLIGFAESYWAGSIEDKKSTTKCISILV